MSLSLINPANSRNDRVRFVAHLGTNCRHKPTWKAILSPAAHQEPGLPSRAARSAAIGRRSAELFVVAAFDNRCKSLPNKELDHIVK